jgi:nucleotide-binding universal stress UspA family protein
MIIVGTDFSSTAALAVSKAQALAQRLGETLEVVHVVQEPRPGSWEPDPVERSWLKAVGEAAHRITIRHGTPWVELVRVADERGAFMIVVGTHGRSGFHTMALGTTASRLALLSPRPTILVSESLLRRVSCISAAQLDPPISLEQDR